MALENLADMSKKAAQEFRHLEASAEQWFRGGSGSLLPAPILMSEGLVMWLEAPGAAAFLVPQNWISFELIRQSRIIDDVSALRFPGPKIVMERCLSGLCATFTTQSRGAI